MKTQLTVLSSYIVSKCQYDWLANMGRSAYIVSVDGVCGHVVCVCVSLQLRVSHDDDNEQGVVVRERGGKRSGSVGH